MNRLPKLTVLVLLLGVFMTVGCSQQHSVRRFGQLAQIKPGKTERYKDLHANIWPIVVKELKKHHVENYSIYMKELEPGQEPYLFAYFEYTGKDFEADMAKLDAEPRNKEWLAICDPMQIPLEGYDSWAEMELVYRND